MSDDVTIDRATARTIAQYHRDRSKASRQLVSLEAAAWHSAIAERLDPQPPSLREQIAERFHVAHHGPDCKGLLGPREFDAADAADAVLAVVKARIDALPKIGQGDGYGQSFGYRVRDVEALFSGVTDD